MADDGIGARVAALRRRRKLTLRELGARAGISESTLSRLENAQVKVNAHSLLKLAGALGVDIARLFGEDSGETITGRRTLTRAGAGIKGTTSRFDFELLCADLAGKRMVPSINRVAARTLAEAGGLRAHPGEEFIHVLSGRVSVHSEFYAPAALKPGDSLYLDSTMGHAYVRLGRTPAVILVVATSPLGRDPPARSSPNSRTSGATGRRARRARAR